MIAYLCVHEIGPRDGLQINQRTVSAGCRVMAIVAAVSDFFSRANTGKPGLGIGIDFFQPVAIFRMIGKKP